MTPMRVLLAALALATAVALTACEQLNTPMGHPSGNLSGTSGSSSSSGGAAGDGGASDGGNSGPLPVITPQPGDVQL